MSSELQGQPSFQNDFQSVLDSTGRPGTFPLLDPSR
jgi:hypothetical protein